MHTMYVDKPVNGHGLMQAIARVNRVFRDKPAGLVVDYIGIAQNLKSALGQYAGHGSEQVGIDEAEAVRVLMENYEIVRAMFRPDIKGGFDYRLALNATATPKARLAIMAGAMDWVLTLQQADAAKEATEDGKKRALWWRCRRRLPWLPRAMKPRRSAMRSGSFRQSELPNRVTEIEGSDGKIGL
jgi:type I restriction enzyme R subunit